MQLSSREEGQTFLGEGGRWHNGNHGAFQQTLQIAPEVEQPCPGPQTRLMTLGVLDSPL